MEPEALNELKQLQTIEQKVKEVQEKLDTRLPTQYQNLTAMVCGVKWRLNTFKPHDTSATIKKIQLELGAFDYRVKEQSELLTRYLIELDGVLSFGNEDIKRARKELVLLAQRLLSKADKFKERSGSLKDFGDRTLNYLKGSLTESITPNDSGVESDDMHVKALFEENEMEDESESEAADVDTSDDEEMEQLSDDEVEDSGEPEAEDKRVYEEGEVISPEKSPRLEPIRGDSASNVDIDSLPVWRPYYQLQRRQDGIYLMARLNITNPKNVQVRCNTQDGVLRITGFRLPTQKDIVMSRLSGAPTFGRFEIIEHFPPNMLNMDEATQQLMEDGTLQIRLPYYVVQHPLFYRPASLFQPQDCFVW
ncbi:BAG domain [Plasmopara halstedii]|uniref:BAG domain n=1 Tax=Plasmopara halstedii TaxID=4781 RepID=A0A0P1B3R0_PLAHL|nr:BAG domain [Plasmopara halstedii]CEG48873.1 BAG domain [Plasmopara halstedii]|eukprot:XP_024585242.1 BAG domain [Plasmopara halstedii]